MYLSEAQIEQIEERTQDIINKAQDLFQVDLGFVDISFTLKGRVAGQANWIKIPGKGISRGYHYHSSTAKDLRLCYNQEAFTKDWDMMFDDTIPHEVAHLVCAVNPLLGKNHNWQWRDVCIKLGGTGNTRHNLKLTPGRTTKRFIYTTTCGEKVDISHVIHTRIQRGQVRTARSTGSRIDNTCAYNMYYKT